MYPMVWDSASTASCSFARVSGIKEALQQFEEDFDYEETLIQEGFDNDAVNFHRFLATPPKDRPGWCGEAVEGDALWSLPTATRCCASSHSLQLKERYRFKATMAHDFPSDRKGYALASTIYGKIYIPEKFRKYVPDVGEAVELTVALQDVWPRGKKKVSNIFRFSAIYLH